MGMDTKQSYKWRILISLDQFANTLMGGSPDETISSRWGRAVRDARNGGEQAPWYARWGCTFLDRIDKDHCRSAIEFDDAGNPRPHHFTGTR